MAYCSRCGVQLAEKAAFCTGCGAAVLASVQLKSAESSHLSSSTQRASNGLAQSASNSITRNLGLEMIQGFSLSRFFSEVFRKHEPDEVERLISVGTPETTPAPDASMGVMPNPWIFFRVLCGTIVAYLIFVFAWKAYPQNLNLVPGLIILGAFAVPFSILILFFELNTPKNISIVKIIKLLMIGGALSLLVTLILFSKWDFLVTTFGASSAGIIEEVAKLAVLIFFMSKMNLIRYQYRLNALLLGATVGAGFAAFESAGYAFRIGLQYGPSAMLDVILLRGILAPFMHIAWTAIAASAFWIARSKHNTTFETLTSAQFLKLFSVPVILHFIWNYNLPFEMSLYVKAAILGFVAWVVILSLVQSGLREMSELTVSKEADKAVAEFTGADVRYS